MVLQGEAIGNTKHLSLTEPARGCHTDVQGHIRGNIHLAALDSTCGGASERQVQVVQRTAFPTRLAEELEDVHVCVSLAPQHSLPVYKLCALGFCAH